jgi:hypothetical protein
VRAALTILIPLIITGLMVFSIVDLLTIDSSRIRALPKFTWIILVILLPLIGGILWFMAGRERLEPREHGRYGAPPSVRRSGPTAPDDDPEFLRRLSREKEQEERIRQLEERLKEIDDDKPKE